MVLHRLAARSQSLLRAETRSGDRLVVGSRRDAHLFSQVRGLTMGSYKSTGTIGESLHELRCDHGACRSAKVCRTAPRIPQLAHRTFLLSLYRSTSNSSYIAIRGGLGDRLAEGVRQTEKGLSMGPQPDVHNEVPGFEVRAKQDHTHRVGLRPAATSLTAPTNLRETDDCYF